MLKEKDEQISQALKEKQEQIENLKIERDNIVEQLKESLTHSFKIPQIKHSIMSVIVLGSNLKTF